MPAPGVNQLSDEELVKLCAQRSTAAEMERAAERFHELYRRHSRALLAFVSARTARSKREDAFQAVWLKVWEKLNSFHSGGFRAWLFQIARNHMIDDARRRGPVELDSDAADPVSPPIDPGGNLLDEERRTALQGCLEELTNREREVVTGVIAGTDYADLCERLHIHKNAAYKATHSARKKLTDCVQRKLG